MIEVVIVGAGISGLTLAVTLSRYPNFNVTVLERAAALELENVGNGIQVPCNAASIMRCLGLLDKMLVQVKHPATLYKNLAYDDGKELVDRNLSVYEELYGAPWLLIHRADYMRLLRDEATQGGVVIKYGCEVCHVDFSAPSVTLSDGHVKKADLVIASDGIHSRIRLLMHPSMRPVPTGEYAYRALFKRSQLASTSAWQHIVSNPSVIRMWLGPGANAVLYPLQDGKLFNLVIIITDTDFNASFRQGEELIGPVRNWLRDWDPFLLQMLDKTDRLVRFPLYQAQILSSWSRGCVGLIGDAAHAMMPHLAQGAAAAVEDAFVLGTLLGRCAQHKTATALDTSQVDWSETRTRPLQKCQIQEILHSYQNIQHERTTLLVSHSRLTGMLDHLPQGPDQKARDADFARFVPEDPESCVSSMPWIDGKWNRELLGRNVDEHIEREFRALVDGWDRRHVSRRGYSRARL
ncbi:hypothetical protein E4U09_001235 [Claviceps aff. purpurea]|uniref:FAD-binding domain-containing protein n=1 Tax=Claviceps aff. purpurea TaxID=1967640 RepID=A0A9P7QHJ3_9HYPO|nr:hypothetical protein E4U09_001235 [Claviceps aff. purpurea]